MSRKTHSVVVSFELSSLFVKISICDALSSRNLFNMMHAKWMCHALTQGVWSIKTFIKYKKCYCRYKFVTKKHKGSSVKWWVHCDKIKTVKSKVPASTTHILKKFSNFCCKIEIFVAFHISFTSNITLVLGFMISNKFYYYMFKLLK